jgi:hypothetical protein
MRGIEPAPITFEVAEDLAFWRAEIPGKVRAYEEALTGPMRPPGKRVHTFNAPGSETGPGTVGHVGPGHREQAHPLRLAGAGPCLTRALP